MSNKVITVTSPLLPDLEEFEVSLADIWQKKWLTNNGQYHRKLESALSEHLEVNHLSLISNGTLALLLALKALNVKGEVITTPYSFVATSSVLAWLGIKPVFVDIDDKSFNIDPKLIEAAITDNTTAIMPVHVYGNPCEHEAIQKIADKYNLKVIYDAAHAFGVKQNGHSILEWGDASILSFHATKVYSTIEGGAVICRDKALKEKIEQLKNFGMDSNLEVNEIGINAKLNEIQAAFGLINLKGIDKAIARRKEITLYYRDKLSQISGITVHDDDDGVTSTYSYFPILIENTSSRISRDQLYEVLAENGIIARKYFYPLISDMPAYRCYVGDNVDFIHAKEISDQVLCLPLHQDLGLDDVDNICKIIKCNV